MATSSAKALDTLLGAEDFVPGLPLGLRHLNRDTFVFDKSLRPANAAEIENPSLHFATAGSSTPGDYEYKKSTRYTDSTCSLFFWLQLSVLVGIGIWGAVQTAGNINQIETSIDLDAGKACQPSATPTPLLFHAVDSRDVQESRGWTSGGFQSSLSGSPAAKHHPMPSNTILQALQAPIADFGPDLQAGVDRHEPAEVAATNPLVHVASSGSSSHSSSTDHDQPPSDSSTQDDLHPANCKEVETYVHPQMSTLVWLLALVAVSGFLFSLLWIAAMLRSGRRFVQFAVAGAILSLGCIAVFGYYVVKSTVLAGLCGGAALIVVIWFCTVKSAQSSFVASNLEVSLGAVGKLPAFWTVVVSTLFAALAFIIICIGLFVGLVSLTQLGHMTTTQSALLLTACAVLFLWSLLVIKHTLYFTIAGAIVDWWKTPQAYQAVQRSWLRSWTTSLGTVAVGSAYIGVLQMLCDCRGMGNRSVNRGRCGAGCSTVCFLCLGIWRKLGDAIEFYSPFAFVFANISGTDLHTSGLRATRLFQDKGLTAIVNSKLVDRALQLSVLSIGLLNACVALGFAYIAVETPSQVQEFNLTVVGTAAALFGLLLGTVSSAAIYAAVQSVFLCWAAWPNKLQENHGMQFYELLDAWMTAYPGTMSKAGYDKFSNSG